MASLEGLGEEDDDLRYGRSEGSGGLRRDPARSADIFDELDRIEAELRTFVPLEAPTTPEVDRPLEARSG
jgi:hypothetical protein